MAMAGPLTLQEILSNPIAVLIYLPFLPLIILGSLFQQTQSQSQGFSALELPKLPPLPGSETTNLEEWTIEEDERGAIHITVHRHVRRG